MHEVLLQLRLCMVNSLRQARHTRWFVRMLRLFLQSVVAYVRTARQSRIDSRRCIVFHTTLKGIRTLMRTMLATNHTWMVLSWYVSQWTNSHTGTSRRQARSVIIFLYVSSRILIAIVGRHSGLFAGCRSIEAELIFIFLHLEMYCALLKLLQSHTLRDHLIDLIHTSLRPWYVSIRSFCSLHVIFLVTNIGKVLNIWL